MPDRILVVEDNALNMQLISDLLTLCGYEVIEATTGAHALVLAEEKHPGLILMDIGLKGMNGLEITHMLKQNPNTADIPVVALTAYVGEADRQRALDSGCIDFVPKPIDTRTLPKLVAHYLEEVPQGGRKYAPSGPDRGG